MPRATAGSPLDYVNCAGIGGVVYRGAALPGLDGAYGSATIAAAACEP